MVVTLLDTATGKTVIVDDEPYDAWWWAFGNGACDCNRERYFGIETAHEYCLGGKRFVISKVEGLRKDDDIDETLYTLKDFNDDYPDELLSQFGIT
jgi:hypothetical protein